MPFDRHESAAVSMVNTRKNLKEVVLQYAESTIARASRIQHPANMSTHRLKQPPLIGPQKFLDSEGRYSRLIHCAIDT
jgi:hypothetical protein